MPKTYPVGTIREWQSGWVIKAHDPMQPFSGGWIPLKTSPQLEEIGINCDHLASSIKNYKLPINGEKFLDHEINEFRDDNGKKIFTADSFKKYEGFYGAGRYAFRNEFSRLFMQNDMQLKEEINSALVRANIEKGGDRKTCALTEEEKSKIRDSVKSTFKELNNPFTVDSANKLYGIVKRVKDQLEEGFDFKDASQKAVYEEFVNAADSIPIVYDKIKVKRELKNRMVSIIDEKFSNNWGVCESCKDYINKKFDEYVKKYSDQISKDTVDEQMERFGVTIDMEPNEFYQRIYDKIDVEIDKDDGSFKDLVYLRFLKKYGKSVDGNWSLNNLPALQNLENIILELPEGHFLKNDKIMLITNKDYSGGDSRGYAWYDSFDKRINLSSDCIKKGSVFGVLKDPDEFRATLFHEIGHSVSEKLGRNNFYDYRKFAVECGWTYQSPELRAGMTATGGDKDIPRTGSNGNIRLITSYAHKSPEEAFAEYYSFYNLQKQDIDKFLDTGNDSFLKKNTVSEIDSAEGIVVGNSNISDRILDISSREYTEFKNTISELSHMYEHDKIELISPWGTVFTQSELQKFDKKNLKEIKDRNVQNMPPTVSYSKNGKNVIIDGITRVEACRMNKKGVPTITLSYELYKTLKDRGWSDITIANCAYTKYRNSQTPYQKKSEVKRYGMVYRHWFVPIETLKENVDVFRTMRKIYNSPELQKALLELFQKSVDDGVSRNMSPNEIAERHGIPVKDIIAQLEIGVKIEMEHTSNKQEAKRIALDHLYELPDYYTRLEIMENQAKDGISVHKIEIRKSGNGILTIFTDVIEKARFGYYADNAENRRLKRVGQQYGSKKEEEQGKSKTKGEEKRKEIDEYTDDDLADFARASTDEDLQRSAVGSNERLRIIAKKELERRKSEGLEDGEAPEEGNVEKEKSEKKSDVKKKPSREEKIDHFFDKLNDEYIIDYKSKDKSIFRRFATNVPEDFLDTFFFLNTVGDLSNNLPESLVKELSETFVDLAPENVYKSLSGGYWVAAYNDAYDKIDINENLYNTIVGGGGYYESDQYRKVLLHEYGHKMYRKGLIDEEIIFKLWRNKERVSSQAKIDHEENFCEAFAAFLMASGSERSLENNRDLKDFYEEFPLTFTIFKTLIDQLNEEQAN